jgi:hypothetical protein
MFVKKFVVVAFVILAFCEFRFVLNIFAIVPVDAVTVLKIGFEVNE